ncbi:MAG: PQQ-binding-like beta-propeller repeat protein [Bacteroidia bacterium]|nr:PQQ-binding-like beta-propeller repeat protein [Bacteroidia bacterium]
MKIKSIRSFCFSLLFLIISPVFSQSSWAKKFPGIGTFSSPRIADLNGDGTGDIILGAGREEYQASDSAFIALDGTNGQMLWRVAGRDQVFGSAALRDLNGDGIMDPVIGGRSAELKAIDGKTGKILWEYFKTTSTTEPRLAGWYNFYNPQFIPDQDGDGMEDILVSNGGDVLVEAYDPNRPAGSLFILSSKSGKLLSQAKMPDGKEIYMSIVVAEIAGEWTVIFGTGGETLGGSLFTVSLEEVRKGDISGAKKLASSETKGFISPPVCVDITGDGVLDIIANSVEGRMYAFNGKNLKLLWEVLMPDTEIYSSLAVGKFTADKVPDFFVSVAQGEWPKLEWNRQFMVDGAKGEIVFSDSLGFYQTSTAVVADLTGDGRDEVLMSVNYQIVDELFRKTFQNMLVVVDFTQNEVIQLENTFEGNNIASTPWIGDLDGNGKLDIIYCHATNTRHTFTFDGMQVNRLDTEVPIYTPVKWGAYMGSNYDGILKK